MKFLITVLAVAAVALTGVPAQAKEKTAQQEKMVACNKDAGDKKGDERKAFMKTCLSAKAGAAASAPAADTGATAACDAKAAQKKLHGAAKTSFTKKCVADAAAAK